MHTEGSRVPVLLDTHVWVWYMLGDPSLGSGSSLGVIEKARGEGSLSVSAISVWEIGMLESRGKLRLRMDCLEWVKRALGAPGVLLQPLSPEIAVASSRLPGELHGDPADRIIAATARCMNATLVTADRRLIEYAQQGFLNVAEA